MDDFLNLTQQDFDILIAECDTEIKSYTEKLAAILIARENLRKKIARWKEEKETLILLKSGLCDKYISDVDSVTKTIGTKMREMLNRNI